MRLDRGPAWLGLLDQTKLLEGGYAVVQSDLLGNLAVFNAEHRRSREVHFPPRRGAKRSDEEIAERWAGVRAAAFPAADDIVALRNEVGCAPEIEIGERFAKAGHKCLDILAAATRRMQ